MKRRNRAHRAAFFGWGTITPGRDLCHVIAMQFEEQSVAQRQMKELLRDQSKFRERLERVVRKIETSSERTAKLAERRKARKPAADGQPKSHSADGDGHAGADGDGQHQQLAGAARREAVILSPAKDSP